MKIGIFGESFLPIYDGVGRVMEAYARVLSSRGHEVYVMVPHYGEADLSNLPYKVIEYHSVRFTKKLPYRIGIALLDWKFRRQMKKLDLDIIHVHGPYFAGYCGEFYARRMKAPLVGTFHTKFYDDTYQLTKSKAIAYADSRRVGVFFSGLDEAWAVSQGAAETLKEYGCRPDNIVVMPNGTDRHELKVDMLDAVAEKYVIRRDVPVFLFVGRINWEKNLKNILLSAYLLDQKGLDFQLVFVGTGPHDRAVKETAERLGLGHKFHMTGYVGDVDELGCLYNLASLFIFPSIYDTSALVLREAAAMHTPGLVVEGSCAAEVVTHMKNGLLVKDSPEDIAEKVAEYLALSEEERKAIEDEAFRTIPMQWDGPLMDMVEERYRNLIEKYKGKKRPLINKRH
ncbi:MAG: glycosyltransferase [Spirochaetales bacterium]|nr:glycosyltransferase [Candidatus Physcosoma equi]